MTQFDVQVQCPACGVRFQVPRIRQGSIEQCPVCAFRVAVPGKAAYEEGAGPSSEEEGELAVGQQEVAAPVAPPEGRLSGRCVVCAAQEGRLNPLAVVPLICQHTGRVPVEAGLQVAKGMGVLAEGVPCAAARQLAQSLAGVQVPAFVLDEALVPQVAREVAIVRVHDAAGEALLLQTDTRGSVRSVPWDRVAGGFCTKMHVVAGGPTELRVERRSYYAPGAGRAESTRYHAVPRPKERYPQCTLLLVGRGGALYSVRFSASQVRYEYLGERRTSSLLQNLRLLLADLVEHCPHGFFPESTRQVAAGQTARVARLSAPEDYHRFLRWVLCCLGHRWYGERAA